MTDPTTIANWLLVFNGGQLLLGRATYEGEPAESYGVLLGVVAGPPPLVKRLSPVYEIQVTAAVARDGRSRTLVRLVVPVAMTNIPYINLPESYAWTRVGDLPASTQRELAEGVDQAEKLREQMRAQEAGIVIAPAGAVPEVR